MSRLTESMGKEKDTGNVRRERRRTKKDERNRKLQRKTERNRKKQKVTPLFSVLPRYPKVWANKSYTSQPEYG